MSDGATTRRGVGRPPGTPNRLTRELADRIQATGQDDVSVALSMVAEDVAVPLDARLEAMRRLFGLLAGKLYASTLTANATGQCDAAEAAALENQG